MSLRACLTAVLRRQHRFAVPIRSFSHPPRSHQDHHTDDTDDMAQPITNFFQKKPVVEKREREEDSDGTEAKVAKEVVVPGVPPQTTIGLSWRNALSAEFQKPYLKKLMDFLAEEAKTQTVYPPANQVYSWSRYTPANDVKVVIIGQDPYHGPGQAHGLCFSVTKGVKPPPSLVNIYKELTTDIPGFRTPSHGYLASWASQGVLLLNAVLTVREKTPNSHAGKGWEEFTDAAIKWINNNRTNVVFILWGAYAQKKGKGIDQKKHFVLNGAHPSPLSVTKFMGCKHFSKTNEYLKSKGIPEINWDSLADDV